MSGFVRTFAVLLAWLRGEGQLRGVTIVVANALGGSTEQVSAHKLAPRAWFLETADRHAVLSLCEDLVLNACTPFGPGRPWAARRFSMSAREYAPGFRAFSASRQTFHVVGRERCPALPWAMGSRLNPR